jgi:hypothetical protein
MALPPYVGQNKAIVHANDPVTIIDYPQYVSIMEWGGAQSSAFGVAPATFYAVPGSGVADDAAAINAAIAALAGSGIGLHFPSGTYLVTAAALVNPSGVPMIGGPGVTFSGTNASQFNAAVADVVGTGAGGGGAFRVRAVMTTTAVASYTGTGTSVLTAGSNAALVAQDGVTLAAGDLILLQGGTLGSLAITAADTGPWIVTSLGSSGTKFVFTRPSWWTTGEVAPTGARIDVGPEGTLFPNTTWTAWAAPGAVIGTTDAQFYPDRVVQAVTLSASTATVSNVPIRSATKSLVLASFVAAGGTTTSTIGYGIIAAPTAGYIGTASAVVDALASGGGKNGSSDASTVAVTVINR